MAYSKKEKSVFFSHVLYLINMYDRYKSGDKSVTVTDLRKIAETFKVGTLKLKLDGTDEEFIASFEKDVQQAKKG